MSTGTVIVNYNAGETLIKCVDAVLKSTRHSKVYVVDNASADGSAQTLRNLYGDHQGIEFLFNPTNRGFAAAVNAVLRRIETDLVLVLNPDCILAPTALERLSEALEKDELAALAGPAVHGLDGHMQRATVRRFPSPVRSLMTATGLWRLGKWWPVFHGVEVNTASMQTGPVIAEAVSGACMLLRREAIAALGYLDEAYAMHCEDLDLMYRLHEQGWRCLYVPQAVCVHQQGVSSRSRPLWVHLQKYRGMARFFNKFEAKKTVLPVRLLVRMGIWLRFVLLWPLALIRR